MRNVAVYIYIDELVESVLTPIRHRLELPPDEAINITSSIQNFRDLGKIFTDYCKSFTIEATIHNNKIVKHWYNSEVGETSLENPLNVDGAFDHRITYYGYIEVDTVVFRYGKFSLTGSKKVNNKIESYSLDFKGNLVQLKERFKDDKLNSLSYIVDGVRTSYYDELNHVYNLSQIEARVQDDTLNVLYPIIGAKRKFYLDSGIPSQDISHTSGKLLFNEIFPAIRVTKILEYIQGAYGITFDGAFIESLTFSKLFLYLKNQDEFAIKPEQLKIDFTSKDSDTRIEDVFGGFIDTATGIAFTDLDLSTDVLTFDRDYINAFYDAPSTSAVPTISYRRSLFLKITTASTNPYNVFVYNNGVLFTSYSGLVGTQSLSLFNNQPIVSLTPIYNLTFFVSSDIGITFTSEIKQVIQRQGAFFGGVGFNGFYSEYQVLKGISGSQSTLSKIDIKSFVPDITVVSFIEGLIKMFNLMVLPTSETSFYLQPLPDYYLDGTSHDITKYVIVDSSDINPPQLFKRIAFKYEKSINILNEFFRGAFNKEYGDLNFENKNSAFSETYEVALPFENFMFERETGTDFMTATLFDKDLKPYVPKPTLIYCNGVQPVTPDIKISDTVTTHNIPQYVRFSNELPLASTDLSYVQSLNWGAEISAWFLEVNFAGLYDKFYSDYIENLFNQRTRILKIKAILPTSLLCSIKLKDKIIVSNKRYIINTMTPELTSGETTFELILDNGGLNQTGSEILRLSNIQTLSLDNTAQEIELQIFLKDNDLWRGKNATGYLVGSYSVGTNIYKDGLLNVSVPANTSGVNRTDNVIVEYFKEATSFEIKIQINQYA